MICHCHAQGADDSCGADMAGAKHAAVQRSASPDEHDRSYFKLLEKIAKLEAANGSLLSQIACCQQDALTYEEVAHELENELSAATAENATLCATLAELEAMAVQADANAECLAIAEATIAQLRAQLQAQRVGAPLEPTSAPMKAAAGRVQEEDNSFLPANTGCDDSDDSATEEMIADPIALAQTQALDTHSTGDVSAECASKDSAAGLPYSLRRMHMQRAAVEYRRAVRQHLQSVCHEGAQSVPRDCLSDLFSTPREMHDDEVLSEDEEESDVCTTRKMSWCPHLVLKRSSVSSVSYDEATCWDPTRATSDDTGAEQMPTQSLQQDGKHAPGQATETSCEMTKEKCQVEQDRSKNGLALSSLRKYIETYPLEREAEPITSSQTQDLDTEPIALSQTQDLDTHSTCDASEECATGLPYSLRRMHMQRAAVEYRRAVRQHLQSVCREGAHSVSRDCLSDLFSTPRDMHDDEVLSEDEEESDVCATRKTSWCRSPIMRCVSSVRAGA